MVLLVDLGLIREHFLRLEVVRRFLSFPLS